MKKMLTKGCARVLHGWVEVLLFAALLLVSEASTAQSITNIAEATWKAGGQDLSIQSNAVTFSVVQEPPRLETLGYADGVGISTSFTPSLCGSTQIYVPGAIGGANPVTSLGKATRIRIGETLYFRLIFAAGNTNSAAIERITVVLTSKAGDREQLEVAETGANSGVFMGAIPTTAVPTQPVHGDCRLGVAGGDDIVVAAISAGTDVIASADITVFADPYGLVFDSEDGTPISGVRVTMVNALTGLPAQVFAEDGVTPYPSSMVSGQPVTDSAGTVYAMAPGEYRFPLAAFGQYRLLVEPAAPYTAPSTATVAQLSGLTRPDGGPLQIVPASLGGSLTLASPAPVRVDIPIDRPGVAVALTKTASRNIAVPGDVVFYTVTASNPDPSRIKRDVVVIERPSPWLRLRPDSVRIDGGRDNAAVQVAGDGRSLTIRLGNLAAGVRRTITYAMTVRPDAPPGQALNRAEATDARGNRAIASAALRIERDTISGRMTLIGRITSGECSVRRDRAGIPGVRVVLEDGSFAITDADGRYHFEGLVPGTHVVQAQGATLPQGARFIDCTRSTRSAGSASSRFVVGQGGSLAVADFTVIIPQNTALTSSKSIEVKSDKAAAGGEADWFALGDGPIDFLFPEIDHNPRAPAVRVVIRHKPGQKIELLADGRMLEPYSFDGSRIAPGGAFAVSTWRAIPIEGERLRLGATVRNADGSVAASLARDVHYAATPAQVQIVPAASRLIADGSTRPVIAVRVTDRQGRPVHAGLTGEFSVNAPYESAQALDAMQSRALAGLGRGAPQWVVKGDDGMAYIELAPTMVSGGLRMEFAFADREVRRRQQLEAWVVPGEQKWTLVGLAEGSVGSRTVAGNMERSGLFESDLGDKARLAFYAKGRVLGKFLLTTAYDSAKQPADQRLLGAIDPNAYYTVFADGSDRRFDAASRKKLYIRIETASFYALFGDFDTGFDQTQLARYQRTITGVKAEVRSGGFHAQGYAAKVASSHRRDEIQGGGISGPYRLSSRSMLANSEVVTIEVRDRFRSELIVSQRQLVRFVDYDIDLLSGTITFSQPILSTDSGFNPQFIVVDYEVDALEGGTLNAGGRADYSMAGGKVRIGGSFVSDGGIAARTNLAGLDLKARIDNNTQVRAELAASRRKGKTDTAWLVEVEHHDGKLDLLAYARKADAEFGVGQANGAELGRRKFGADARYNITQSLSAVASAWHDVSLTDLSKRDAVQLRTELRGARTDARVALTSFTDRLRDGTKAGSTVLEGGVTQRYFDNKLELDASSSLPLGKTDSIDLPARHRFSARYAVTSDVRLVGSYEIAEGDAISARTARAGMEVTPWRGGRMIGTIGQQDISEFGKRSFAAFGLAQSVEVNKSLILDATVDSSRTLGGFNPAQLINAKHPAASGGNRGDAGTVAEDFIAVTLGGTWRAGRWSATLRGEWRDGELADRKGVTVGAIRQIGGGSMVGSGLLWTRAVADNGALTESFNTVISAAHRPDNSRLAFLTKLEYRADKVENGVAGETGPAGRSALAITGDAQSRRLIGSVSANWSPRRQGEGRGFSQRSELGLFLGTRYNFDRLEGYDVKGWTLLAGGEARLGLTEKLEIGVVGTARHSVTDGTTSFAIGPHLGFTPGKDALLTLGYNIAGFRDRDFSASHTTDKGVFASLRLKFDADSFSFLGLGR